jgi:hypothetical protein
MWGCHWAERYRILSLKNRLLLLLLLLLLRHELGLLTCFPSSIFIIGLSIYFTFNLYFNMYSPCPSTSISGMTEPVLALAFYHNIWFENTWYFLCLFVFVVWLKLTPYQFDCKMLRRKLHFTHWRMHDSEQIPLQDGVINIIKPPPLGEDIVKQYVSTNFGFVSVHYSLTNIYSPLS